MEHISQEDQKGCGIACVAMVAGMSYQVVKERLTNPRYDMASCGGLDDLVMPQLLLQFGCAGVITYPYNPVTGERRVNWPSLPTGRVHIACVQTPRGAHYVVVLPVVPAFGFYVLDPARPGVHTLVDYSEVHYFITVFPEVA